MDADTAAMVAKPDFASLLAPGFHCFTLDGIRHLCCFPNNLRRSHLFLHLEQLVQDLLIRRIPCEMWIDGSFLTTKEEPGDLDVIVKFDYDVTKNFTSYQKELVDALGDGSYDGSYNERIDSFVFTCLRRDHPEFEAVEDERSEWARLYSVEHGDFWLKGVAVLRPGETDVGLRFHP